MNHLMWLASPAGLISTAVIFGTDMFFLTVGRPALKLAPQSTATELMGFIHLFGDRRMPIWGILAMFSNLFLILVSRSGHRAFYLLSLSMLILFVFIYDRFAKPINRLQTEAAKKGTRLDNARVLQVSWDRWLAMRVPLLAVSMFAQFVALLATSA
jgi:Domain of unknown function (DUF1772)